MSFHTFWAPPPSIPPVPNAFIPSVEIPIPMMWTVGYLMGKNKFTTTVLTCGMPTCKSGHDQGPLIPDITIPPVNVYMPPIGWLFSKRAMVFQATTVTLQGTPTGCAASPFFPMLTCGDPVSLPTVFPIPINYLHRTFVGLTVADIISGLMNIAISVAIDAIFYFAFGRAPKPGSQAAQETAERVAREVAEQGVNRVIAREIFTEFAGKVMPTSGPALAKSIVTAAAGYLESMANEALHPSDNAPSTKLSLGGGIVPTLDLNIGGQPDRGPDNAPAEAGELGRTNLGGQRVGATTEGGSFGDPLDIF